MAWENYGNAWVIEERAGLDAKGNIIAWEHEAWTPALGNRPGPSTPGNVITGMLIGYQPAPFTPATAEEPKRYNNGSNGIPSTYVPFRNAHFLAVAVSWAEVVGATSVFIGAVAEDSSGYPDCRDDTIKAMQVALGLGMNRRFVLHTPLMWVDKADTFALAETIGGRPMLDLVIEATHSCYLGDRTHRHDWGYGCGSCPACKLRADGFARFVQERR
jgi:queuosine biosynthesis protein QueC